MKKFYEVFEDIKHRKFDGMIITGAPVEKMNFDEVNYWKELSQIMEWSKTHITSTLHICWAAQAGLYYHYGVKKVQLEKKLSGIYRHHVMNKKEPLVRGFDDFFMAPHSLSKGLPGGYFKQSEIESAGGFKRSRNIYCHGTGRQTDFCNGTS